jgi:NADH-quinone oxidoreductase subunit A
MTWSTLLMDASATNLASNYLPIGIQLIFAAGFVATMIGVSQWVGPKRKTSDKLENFASAYGHQVFFSGYFICFV